MTWNSRVPTYHRFKEEYQKDTNGYVIGTRNPCMDLLVFTPDDLRLVKIVYPKDTDKVDIWKSKMKFWHRFNPISVYYVAAYVNDDGELLHEESEKLN